MFADTLEAFDLETATEAGFFGKRVDPTPNHAYTVEGAGAGEATPETDETAKQAAVDRAAELVAENSGTGASEAPAAAKTSSSSKSS
jgi:hypothetical protein